MTSLISADRRAGPPAARRATMCSLALRVWTSLVMCTPPRIERAMRRPSPTSTKTTRSSSCLTLYDGVTLLGVLPVSAYGTRSFVTNMLSVGNHPVTVVYSRSATDVASTSAAVLTQQVH
jgi:hypothetical protein